MDFVVLGFGTGSQLSDLTEWLRNIDSWLKPDGIIFITFINEDSIVLKIKNTLDGYCRTNPPDISSLGKFAMENDDEYLVKCIPQNVDTIKKNYWRLYELRGLFYISHVIRSD